MVWFKDSILVLFVNKPQSSDEILHWEVNAVWKVSKGVLHIDNPPPIVDHRVKAHVSMMSFPMSIRHYIPLWYFERSIPCLIIPFSLPC